MIPKKAGTDTNLNEQIDKDLSKAEEQQKEKIAKSKPKLAQAIGSKYVKYFAVIITGCVIGYKMFFAPTPENQKKKKVKKEFVSKEAQEQKKMADTSVAKKKDGEIVKEKPDANKVLSIDERTMLDTNSVSNVNVTKLNITELPQVPMIDKITIEDDEERRKQSEKDRQKINELTEVIKKNEADIEALKKMMQESNDNVKQNKQNVLNLSNKNDNQKNIPSLTTTKKVKKRVKDANGKNKVIEVEVEVDEKGNIIREKMQDTDKIDDGEILLGSSLTKQLATESNNGKKNGLSGKVASTNVNSRYNVSKKTLDEMFILSGKGASSAYGRQSNGDNKKDFIIFDGSSISEKEISTTDQSTANVNRVSNLENTIMDGKVMEAVLETAISSEAAGMVRAVMSRDVLGESGDKILIPRGSRLYGSYTTTSTTTQTRLLLTWTKVIRPDGVVITMNADTYDQSGKKGIEGDIDTKYGELFKNSLLYSFVTLGTAIAVEKIAGIKGSTSIVANNGTSVTNTSPANAAATSVIDTAKDIAEKMTDGLTDDLNPVISIPQGMLLKIISSTDIVINSAYKRRTKNPIVE